ncbi:MAG: AAA family ATPase [Bacteroidales bacterium]|nr:AAA family ATPase [Bacteroidales bacterium]
MQTLQTIYKELLSTIDTKFVRYMYSRIAWNSKLNVILGARGVGKTTMMLQHILMSGEQSSSLYILADNPYFTTHTLYDTAYDFVKNGGRHLYIDEIHKYSGWSREVKMMYDVLRKDLQVTVSGSSMIDMIRGLEADLSRRALAYRMEGLSFREYLNLSHKAKIEPYTLEAVLDGQVSLPRELGRPLPLFNEYLRRGYYPFFNCEDYLSRFDNVVLQTLEVDIPRQTNMTLSTALKLKKLMSVVAQSTPFKPNFSHLGRVLEMNRTHVADMIAYMERAGLLRQLREDEDIMDQFAKVEKVYLANSNLCYALCDSEPDRGTLRETFFFSQMAVGHKVSASPVADFIVDGHTFEVGGRNKKKKQIASLQDAFVVKDDIEYAYQNIIPLWMFGLTY